MPHFTVTKVEDKEEGAEASVSQEEEIGLAEIKTHSPHSGEPGESSVWKLLRTMWLGFCLF